MLVLYAFYLKFRAGFRTPHTGSQQVLMTSFVAEQRKPCSKLRQKEMDADMEQVLEDGYRLCQRFTPSNH